MTSSETQSKVLAKIAEVSTHMEVLVKSETNPFFKNKYVKLEQVQEALAPLLKEYKVGVAQPSEGKGITTIVSDLESGEWFAFPSEINSENLKPQDQMAGVTYMKRYALVGLFNLQTGDKDDDGNTASGRVQTAATKQEEIDI